MKRILDKFLILLLLFSVLSAYGKVMAEYVFELNIDEPLKDLSSNHLHPESTPPESAFVRTAPEAVRFTLAGCGIKLPFKAFPGSCGALETLVMLDSEIPEQRPLLVIYGKQDNIMITVRNRRYRVSIYDRSEKKWYHSPKIASVHTGRFVKLSLAWSFPGKLTLTLDDKAKVTMPVDFPVELSSDSEMYLGSDPRRKALFPGAVHNLRFTDGKEVAVKKAAGQGKAVIFKSGSMELKFNAEVLGVAGWKVGKVEYLSGKRKEPLWLIRLHDRSSGEGFDIAPENAAVCRSEIKDDRIILYWDKVALPGSGSVDVKAEAVVSGKDELSWYLETSELSGNLTVDQVSFPRLAGGITSKNPQKMYLCYPRYFGVNIPDAFGMKRQRGSRFSSDYPGGAHYQFCYLYSKEAGGIYLHTDDAAGNYKVFEMQSFPKDKTLLVSVTQSPDQRNVAKRFVSQYPVRTAVIYGDWYDAASRYRSWAVRQPWCAKGTLAVRKDMPSWVYTAQMAFRPQTLTAFPRQMADAEKRVVLNISNYRTIHKNLPCGAIAVWYCYNCPPAGTKAVTADHKWMSAFNARPEQQLIPGIDKAVAEFKRDGVYTLGYLNSRIYDESTDPAHADSNAVKPLVMLNADGTFQRYQNKPFDVCRHASGWQRRLLDIIRHDAVKNGFAGMYLDSFGRGQGHCWAVNHGHLPGSSTASVTGQRQLAELIKTEMRKIIPGFVISSEASVENFVDLIDFKLHHYNIFPNGVPVWTRIYHDYQFVYGRFMDVPLPQLTGSFHLGALLGRFFTGFTEEKLREKYFTETTVEYARKLIAMRQYYHKQIGIGEMLRRPEIKSDAAPTEVDVRKRGIVKYDAVQTSAWRSKENVPVVFFTNHTDKELTFEFKLDARELPARPTALVIADRDGKLHKEKFNGKNVITLPPLGVAALEF